MGDNDGNIMATIMTAHMPMNDAAAPIQPCPHIGCQTIASSGMAAIEAFQQMVATALATKTSATMPTKM